MEVKGKKNFTGKSGKTSQGRKRFKKDDDSKSPKKFPNKGDEGGGPKFSSNKFEKSNTKPGKTGMKQLKNKQQGNTLPKKTGTKQFQNKQEGDKLPKKTGTKQLKSKQEAGDRLPKKNGTKQFKKKQEGSMLSKKTGVKQFKKKQEGDMLPKKTSPKQFKNKQTKRKFQSEGKGEETAAKKPKWDELKKKKKELRHSRQLSDKNNYDTVIKAKQIWEYLRRKNCDKEKRIKLMSELQKLMQGKIKSIAFAHDSTRIIQCYIQYGNEEQRKEAFEELKESWVELSKARYSRNVVKKFLMYGNKSQIAEIIKSFKGQVRKMLRHAEASAVVEYAYNDKAILEQRNMLVEELYGNTFQLYKSAIYPTLEKVLEVQPDKQQAIMDEMKQILTPLAQKETVIKHSLVHKVFLDFFTCAPPKLRSEMIEAIREAVIYLAHTHDGARVAMYCLWHGTPKDRKVIIKTMKTYVEKVANGEYSHLVLLAAFDCVDDTKLVKQIVMSEIISSLPDIVNNKYGRKVLLYLLSPRDPAHLVPEIIEILQKGDGNAHSKKDSIIRRKELLESISPALLSYMQEHVQKLVTDKSTCVFVVNVLGSAIGDIQPALNTIARLATPEMIPGGKDGEFHMAEHPAGHLVLKWLLEQDEKMKESGKDGSFAKTLVEHVGVKKLKSWAGINRGALILSRLLQNSDPEVTNKVKSGLKSLIPTLEKEENASKGITALLEKLKA
ncbi:pumilio homolog 3 [Monodelphis domestica]|uniref:Pumilio homolog 3 n=1 Tax=Monodelphis domestica TaxID=13616 RepID=F6T3D8_MONDO|nr:pumilio homolog 3 [Monodelphis domestica]XP_007499578.1 pumilio homolog 3 [Monodelphis domestica]XP_007499579.1 pumilio homolog 3 [Monodelphis domestica]XP_007499580.1 pumilio homolog 3 [Monodelphis domestica]